MKNIIAIIIAAIVVGCGTNTTGINIPGNMIDITITFSVYQAKSNCSILNDGIQILDIPYGATKKASVKDSSVLKYEYLDRNSVKKIGNVIAIKDMIWTIN